MKHTLIFLLLCSSFYANAGSQKIETEEQIAARDVWHAAKLRGVSFRAIGQEPAWLLEITNGESFFLSTNYGQTKTTYPYVEPVVNQKLRKTVYPVKNTVLEIIIEGINCIDVMSGRQFEVTVSIKENGKILKGCGQALY